MKNTLKTLLFLLIFMSITVGNTRAEDAATVAIEWYGHSCYLLTLQSGGKILTDPYNTEWMPYQLPSGEVDVVFSTHDHFDHNAVDAVPSKLILLPSGSEPTFAGSKSSIAFSGKDTVSYDLKGTEASFTTAPSYHDQRQGELRGVNGIVRFEVAGLTFVHLGDLGHLLSPEQIELLQPVDVLMIPVGGYYTIDASLAKQVAADLAPRIVLPMHYKTEVLSEGFPIEDVEPFLEGYNSVERRDSSIISIRAGELPDSLTIVVLKYHGQD